MGFDVERHTIFVTLAGSQAHGTARAGSDVDLRGVCIAPLPMRVSLFSTFEQYEGGLRGELWDRIAPRLQEHATARSGLEVRSEAVIFELSKFLKLCAAANPNALEILFADERDWLHETAAWRQLWTERSRFLTQKVQQTYLGYAMAQLKKIKTHRSWLLHPPAQKPTRTDFGLPDAGTLGRDDQNRIEQSIAEKIRSYGIETVEMPKAARIAVQDRLQAFIKDALSTSEEELESRLRAVATHALELPREVVATLNAEKKYLAAMKHWESYQTWKTERNAIRAELESRHGYDTKHAMHLIRLMKMGLEVLEAGELRVRRADAAELNAIRDGALPYEKLLEAAEELRTKMEAAAERTRLPTDVDYTWVDAMAFELIAQR